MRIQEIPSPPKASPSMAENIANTYITLAGKWAHITSKISIKTTYSFERVIFKRIRPTVGLRANDSTINLYCLIDKHDLGLRNFTDLHITSRVRKLDVNLHSRENHGCAIRNSNKLSNILSRTLKPKNEPTYKHFLSFNLHLHFLHDTYKHLESQTLAELITITSIKLKGNRPLPTPSRVPTLQRQS